MDSFDALRRDISDLGHLLGDVLVEQEGAQLLELEEKIRALAKERRREGRKGPAAKEMLATIEGLDTATAEQLARAFTHYFQLVNLAEQHHRTRRRRDYARAGQVQEGTFAHELGRIGATREELQAVLAATQIELVFTAHPSEAQRRTVLEKHRRIADLLARRDRSELTPDERMETNLSLREEVTSLWQTDELRREKPLVADEVKNTLFYLEEVLFPLVPRFYEALETAASKAYGPIDIPRILTFGSWVGGDMDGNPNVTPAVALDTAFAMGARILQLYLNEISRLGSVLSQSRRRVAASDELPDSIEPYRAELTQIANKLTARRDVLIAGRKDKSTSVDYGAAAYHEPSEMLSDLAKIARSLEENKGANAGLREVRALIRQVDTFGFCLAKMDVRIPAPWVRAGNDSAKGAIEALGQIRKLTGGAESLIMSMCRGADDMVQALAMATSAGLRDEDVAIVPLFETLADLQRAAPEIEEVCANPRYASYLDHRNRVQELMIGYSDSNKDAGILSSSFALYRAQQELVAVGKRSNLSLSIFHGRGGSIGRGGGPSQRAIQSLPHGSITGRFKLTEQGEVVGWKYLLSEIAERNLELTASGVLAATAAKGADVAAFEDAFEEVSTTSLAAYRALVHDPDFVRYYEQSTPLEEIAKLNIGSRPSRRSEGPRTLDDLRAIPWVFAWTQSRQMVPGWYGAGRALEQLIEKRGLAYAQKMLAEWPFFASTLDAVAVSLATADMEIAARYAALVGETSIARKFFGRIALDHARASRAVQRLANRKTTLDPNSTLARSIALRNPYVDPLSFIQIELLKRKRAGQDLDRAILLTINGVAAGLRNTG